MTTPKIFKSQTLDFGPAMPLQLSKKPTENEPHVAKMRWFNIGTWTAVGLTDFIILFSCSGYMLRLPEQLSYIVLLDMIGLRRALQSEEKTTSTVREC